MRYLPSRRWFQFRLSTWFLVVAIIALSVSLWRKHRALDAIENWYEAMLQERTAIIHRTMQACQSYEQANQQLFSENLELKRRVAELEDARTTLSAALIEKDQEALTENQAD